MTSASSSSENASTLWKQKVPSHNRMTRISVAYFSFWNDLIFMFVTFSQMTEVVPVFALHCHHMLKLIRDGKTSTMSLLFIGFMSQLQPAEGSSTPFVFTSAFPAI